MHFNRKFRFDPFEEQFISPFFSDCPSLILGIAIRYIQHSQAMLERGVCELAHSFFHSCYVILLLILKKNYLMIINYVYKKIKNCFINIYFINLMNKVSMKGIIMNLHWNMNRHISEKDGDFYSRLHT